MRYLAIVVGLLVSLCLPNLATAQTRDTIRLKNEVVKIEGLMQIDGQVPPLGPPEFYDTLSIAAAGTTSGAIGRADFMKAIYRLYGRQVYFTCSIPEMAGVTGDTIYVETNVQGNWRRHQSPPGTDIIWLDDRNITTTVFPADSFRVVADTVQAGGLTIPCVFF